MTTADIPLIISFVSLCISAALCIAFYDIRCDLRDLRQDHGRLRKLICGFRVPSSDPGRASSPPSSTPRPGFVPPPPVAIAAADVGPLTRRIRVSPPPPAPPLEPPERGSTEPWSVDGDEEGEVTQMMDVALPLGGKEQRV